MNRRVFVTGNTGLSKHWRRPDTEYLTNPAHEAGALALDCSNARNLLEWQPPWQTEKVIEETAKRYRSCYSAPLAGKATTIEQIAAWRSALR